MAHPGENQLRTPLCQQLRYHRVSVVSEGCRGGALHQRGVRAGSLDASGIRSRFEVAVAETGFQDKWQRAELGVAAVGAESYHLKRVMHSVQRFVDRFGEVELIGAELTMHSPED